MELQIRTTRGVMRVPRARIEQLVQEGKLGEDLAVVSVDAGHTWISARAALERTAAAPAEAVAAVPVEVLSGVAVDAGLAPAPAPAPPALQPATEAAASPAAASVREQLAPLLPKAEMGLKAALAIWCLLGLTMIVFHIARSMFGLGGGLAALVLAGVAYAIGTAVFLYREYPWIKPDATDPQEQRLHRCLSRVVAKAGLPLPRVALDRDDADINAFTYGLSPRHASVVVTRGLIDHMQPTDEELTAILAHEVSHIHHRDSMISTLLNFPIWMMHQIRNLLGLLRGLAGVALRVVSSVAVGWVGLVLVLGLLFVVLYLSLWIFLATLAIFVAMVFLNAFEREREYVADLYAACLVGSTGPIQAALGRLHLAAQRVVKTVEERAAQAGEGQEVDTTVAPPDAPLPVTAFLQQSLGTRPSFARSAGQFEFMSDHPITENRLYYLEHPQHRQRWVSKTLQALERLTGKAVGDPSDALASILWPAFAAGFAAAVLVSFCGVPGAVLALLWKSQALGAWLPWIENCLETVGLLMTGAGLGWWAARQAWSGRSVARALLLSAFVASCGAMVLGPIANQPQLLLAPLGFLYLLALQALAAVPLARWRRGNPPAAAGSPTPATASAASA